MATLRRNFHGHLRRTRSCFDRLSMISMVMDVLWCFLFTHQSVFTGAYQGSG